MYVDRSNLPGTGVKGSDEGLFAQFSIEPVHLTFKSAQEGRPVYEDREHIRILIAGDLKSEVFREATDEDRMRFAQAYMAFKNATSQHEGLIGTPLREWPAMTPALVRNFQGVNIFTVEQLATLSDTGIQNAGLGAREWVERAKAYLDTAAKGAASSALQAENEQLKNDLAVMRKQLEAVAQQAAETSAKQAELANAEPAAPAVSPEAIAQMIAAQVSAALNAKAVNDDQPAKPAKSKAA